MSNWNIPRWSAEGIKWFLKRVISTRVWVQDKIHEALWGWSLTNKLFKTLSEGMSDIERMKRSKYRNAQKDSHSTIKDYLLQAWDESIQSIDISDITAPEWMTQNEYSSRVSWNWWAILMKVLGKSLKVHGTRTHLWRFSQRMRALLQQSLPKNIHKLVLSWYKSNWKVEDFDNTVFLNELEEVGNLFTDSLNVLLRINVLLEDDKLWVFIQDILVDESIYEKNNAIFVKRELRRIALVIEVLESWVLDGIINPQTLSEILAVRLKSLQVEIWCVNFWRLHNADVNLGNKESSDKIDDILNAQGVKIIHDFSELYASLTSLKKKTQSMHIQREAIGNLLDIKVSEVLAKKIFDEQNPLYHLIFKNTYTNPDGESFILKTSSEFKNFLLRLMTKFSKIPMSDEIKNTFSFFYMLLLKMNFEERLSVEKQNKILRFLNSTKNPERHLDFCIFIIAYDLEDIDIMRYLSDQDRDFITRNFGTGFSDSTKILSYSAKILAQLEYRDLCKMQTLSPDELSTARSDIDTTKCIFRVEQIQAEISENLTWLPQTLPWYAELTALTAQDMESQDEAELRKALDDIYHRYDISNFARTHKLLLSSLNSTEQIQKELEQIWALYQAFSSQDNHSMRAYIQEIYALRTPERARFFRLITAQRWEFDYSVLLWNISELLAFIQQNNFVDEDIQTIWELFQEEQSDTKPYPEKQETDASIFIEMFWEELGLRIAVLQLHRDINHLILRIGSALSDFHARVFVEFIESKKTSLKKSSRETLARLEKLLLFAVMISNNSLYNLSHIERFYEEIWNLDADSEVLTEISDTLDSIRIHDYPEFEKYLYSTLLEEDTSKLKKYIASDTNISTEESEWTQEYTKLASANPWEVIRKLESLGYTSIKTRTGHNKYRWVNNNWDTVMVILPIWKWDVNKYILRQIVNICWLSVAEWERL